MRDYDHFFVLIGLQDRSRPRERSVARNIFQHQEKILLAVNGQHSVEILIAAGRVAAQVIGVLGIARRPEPGVKAGGRAGGRGGIVVVVIADGEKIRHPGVVEGPDGRVSILLLSGGSSIIHDVA